MPTKGEEIRFIGGKYAGKQGWLDIDKEADDRVTPVILNLGKKKGKRDTFVYNGSWVLMSEVMKDPHSYARAVIQQCPEVHAEMVKFFRKLAKFDIDRDRAGFIALLDEALDDAVKHQISKGTKAEWRGIEYNATNGTRMDHANAV